MAAEQTDADRQGDQVRIVLQRPLQARVVTRIGKQANASGDFKGPRDAADYVAITLPVEFDLPGFVLYQLRLIPSFDSPQLISAAARQQYASQRERQQPDQQQHCEHDIKQTNSAWKFEHG